MLIKQENNTGMYINLHHTKKLNLKVFLSQIIQN